MNPREISVLRDGLISGLKEEINLLVLESVNEQAKHKDEEVSGLHREIKNSLLSQSNSINELKELVKSHDEVIQELRQIYKTSGYIKKFILWILVFIPSVAGFFGGLRYLYNLIVDNLK